MHRQTDIYIGTYIQTDTDLKRQRDMEKDTSRQTERHRDSQTDKHADRQSETKTETQFISGILLNTVVADVVNI